MRTQRVGRAGRHGRKALLAVMAAAALTLACQDLTGVRDIGKDDGGSTGSGALYPEVSVELFTADSSGTTAKLEEGDSVKVTASDSLGVSYVGAVLIKGSVVVWRSDTVSAGGELTATKVIRIAKLSVNFPYDSSLVLAGYASNTRKKARYSGTESLDASDASGINVVVTRASQVTLKTGTFNDIAIDYARNILYYADPTQNGVGYVDLSTFSMGTTQMTPGSRPTHLALVSPGLTSTRELVVFAAGSRDYAVYDVSSGPRSGSPLYRVESPIADVKDLSSGTATVIAELPSPEVSRIVASCPQTAITSSDCVLFVGTVGRQGGATVAQILDLSQGAGAFDMLTPATLPGNGVLAGKDTSLVLAADVDIGGRMQRAWTRSGRSKCASLFGDSLILGIRQDLKGSVYVATTCDLPLVKLDRTRLLDEPGTSYDIDAAAATNTVRDNRYQGTRRISVSGGGTRVLAETGSKLLVADADLRVRGELPPASSPLGSGFFTDPSRRTNVGDGEWVAVSFADKVVIYSTLSFRPVAQFSTAKAMTGDLEFFTTSSGTNPQVLIIGRNSDNTALVKIQTSVNDIRQGAGL